MLSFRIIAIKNTTIVIALDYSAVDNIKYESISFNTLENVP